MNTTSEVPQTRPDTALPHEERVRRSRVFVVGVPFALVLLIVVGVSAFSVQYRGSERIDIPHDVERQESWALREGDSVNDVVDTIDVPQTDETYPETEGMYVNTYPELRPDAYDYTAFYRDAISQEGVVWYNTPELFVPTVSPFVCDTSSACGEYGLGWIDVGIPPSKRLYYTIGTYQGKRIVYTNSFQGDPGGVYPAYFLTDDSGSTFTFIARNSLPSTFSADNGLMLADTVRIDTDTSFRALEVPPILTLNGASFAVRAKDTDFFGGFREEENTRLLSNTSYGPVFIKTIPETIDGVVPTGYLYFGLRLQGGLMAYLHRVIPFMQDDGVPNITFTDGTKNTYRYRGQLGGCGRGTVPRVALEPILDADLAYVGNTSSGEKVYNLTRKDHPLINQVFDITGGAYYTYENGVSEEHAYTRDEFVSSYGILVYTDQLGYQNILTNEQYGPQAECGKPVIYLYPEATTTITVSVDADITKSEPPYNNGWTVTASPEGTLVHADGVYTSLFWDGYGHGMYPHITEGVIVPTGEALHTMESHLEYMGFTTSEIRDFSEFWKDHLPTKPFTRITWFFTREMEELAKLTVTPAPDTLIRVFVDYEGLDRIIPLPTQKLPRFTRTGYTVTEWGGLLRSHVSK